MGLDSYGIHLQGRNEMQMSQIRLLHFDTTENLRLKVASLEAIQGALATFINDQGTLSQPCLIKSVGVPQISPAVGETGGFRLEVTVQLLAI